MRDAARGGMLDRGSLVLFRVRGVPIRAHWTLLLVIPYLALVLSFQLRTVAEAAGIEHAQLVLPPFVWGAVLALGVFASVAVHELAHAVVALHYGGRVRSITLMLVGGVSQITSMPERPRAEALMAAAGPAVSLALAAIVLLLDGASSTWPADLHMGLFYLGGVNLILGLFNLVPAFPMDGGRILRAAIASRRGRAAATRVATSVGKVGAVGSAWPQPAAVHEAVYWLCRGRGAGDVIAAAWLSAPRSALGFGRETGPARVTTATTRKKTTAEGAGGTHGESRPRVHDQLAGRVEGDPALRHRQ